MPPKEGPIKELQEKITPHREAIERLREKIQSEDDPEKKKELKEKLEKHKEQAEKLRAQIEEIKESRQ